MLARKQVQICSLGLYGDVTGEKVGGLYKSSNWKVPIYLPLYRFFEKVVWMFLGIFF